MIHTTAKQVNDVSVKLDNFGNMFNQIFDTMNAMKQELFVIRNKQVEQSSNKNITKSEKPTQRVVIDVSKPAKEVKEKDEISKDIEDVKEKDTYANKVKKNLKVDNHKNEEFSPNNILMVADSHSYNLDRNIFENNTKTKLDMAIAFTVDEDVDAKYRSRNFLKVVPERLGKKKYDTLIMQAGSNEISNINLESPSLNITQWEKKVEESREKVFQLAQKSLKSNPSLKKVLIVKSLPRYDPSTLDPSSIKSKLNKFGNTVYDRLWLKSGCPNNIHIVDQQMDCQGPLREKRFGNPGSVGQDGKPWDGIHMRGKMAAKHYTHSLARIVSALNPQGDGNYHKTCPQAIYQHRWQYNNKAKYNNNPQGDENYHMTCPQALYQRSWLEHRQNNHNTRYNNKRVESNNTGFQYQNRAYTHRQRYGGYFTHPQNIITSNRFSILGN